MSVQPIDLDPPDDPDDDPRGAAETDDADPLGSLPTLELPDMMGQPTRLIITPDGEGGLSVAIVLGDPADPAEPFARLNVDLDADAVLRLHDAVVAPSAEATQADKAEQVLALAVSRDRDDREYRERAFVVRSALLNGCRRKTTVHRSTCAAVRKPVRQHGTMEDRLAADRVQEQVDLFVGTTLREYMSEARAVSRERWQREHPGSPLRIGLRIEPLHFCGTCKPLGEFTTQAGVIINRALESRSDDARRFDPLEPLAAQISLRLWSTAQEHLDAVRGG